uniref:Uncharacterized protein n=1 Tax=Arundo donax TaxID=35708 RepID=A0A0A8ZNW6_ARUDO
MHQEQKEIKAMMHLAPWVKLLILPRTRAKSVNL